MLKSLCIDVRVIAVSCVACVLFLVTAGNGYSVDRSAAFELNKRLGRGVNIGNTFEASPKEDSWGNPWKPEYLKTISDAGFKHIRLPVNWETDSRAMMEAPYTIKPEFLNRIKGIVDEALKYKLMIIVNMHHHYRVHQDPEASRERFLSQWAQIAAAFKDYPDTVVFEVMNEPQGKLTGDTWRTFFVAALEQIRKTNPRRVVLLGEAQDGKVPDDAYLIYTPHFYSPHFFTHQKSHEKGSEIYWGTEWLNTQYERDLIGKSAADMAAFGKKNNIPVHIGELGVIKHADMASRARWISFTTRCFEKYGFSWALWDFSALFGVYDREAGKIYPELEAALLRNPMPAPATSELKTIFSSDFTTTKWWNFQANGNAKAKMEVKDGAMIFNIENPGTASWHVQLQRWGGYKLEKKKLYMVSYEASDTAGRDVTCYIGNTPMPWNHFTHSKVTPEGSKPYYCFSMGTNSDSNPKFALDVGGGKPSTFVLKSVKIDEIVLK